MLIHVLFVHSFYVMSVAISVHVYTAVGLDILLYCNNVQWAGTHLLLDIRLLNHV